MSGRVRSAASVLVGLASLVPLAGAPTAAEAQGAHRSGFWLEVGWGAGTVRSACSACPTVTTAYGTSTHVRAGAALSSRALLGLELFALHSTDLVLADGTAPVDARNGSVAPVVLWYVGPSGLFLKGGVGLATGTFTVRPESGEPVTTERMGSTITFGVGFDVGVLRRLALTANLGMNVMAIGDVDVDGTVADDVVATVYEAGIGITLR
jgi:hypothetical protein